MRVASRGYELVVDWVVWLGQQWVVGWAVQLDTWKVERMAY